MAHSNPFSDSPAARAATTASRTPVGIFPPGPNCQAGYDHSPSSERAASNSPRSRSRSSSPLSTPSLVATHEAGGDAERAARFLGAAERLFHEVEAAVDPEELETQEAISKRATEALGADALEAMRAVGAETPVDELVPVPS